MECPVLVLLGIPPWCFAFNQFGVVQTDDSLGECIFVGTPTLPTDIKLQGTGLSSVVGLTTTKLLTSSTHVSAPSDKARTLAAEHPLP